MKQRIRTWLVYIPYVVIGIVVLGPLLAPGFVLTMDMVFTPTLRMPDHVDNTWLLYATLHVANNVLPADVLQKGLLLAILLLGGIGFHRLVLSMEPDEQRWRLAAYCGGVFYVVNPFVYDRFMAGQYGVLLGYALLPWFCRSVLGFGRNPEHRRAVRLGLWLSAIGVVSIHSLGFALLIGMVAGIASWQRWRDYASKGWLVLVVFVGCSAYWLLPTLLGQGRIADSLATFNAAGRDSFATTGANVWDQVGGVLGLMGFWQEGRSLYALPEDAIPAWQLVQLVVLAFVGVGIWRAWRRRRRVALVALAIGLLAAVAALGVIGWLADHLPLLAGYREPQKFVALLALVYAFFLTQAVGWLVQKTRWKYAAVGAVVVLVLAYTPTMLWGFYGQLRPVQYPRDWSEVNALLRTRPDDSKVLFLPWHLYMSFGFSGRIIANPAQAFFDRQVIASNDPELPGVAPQTRNNQREVIQQAILPDAAHGQQVAQRLRALGVGYVLLSKEVDYDDYAWLDTQRGTQLMRDTATLRLYKLTNDTMVLHEDN